MKEIIVLASVAVFLFIVTQVVKTIAKDFFTKISKFVPLIEFAFATILSSIALLLIGEGFDISTSVKNGFIIASAEVYSYEGIYKLLEKCADALSKAKNTVEKVEEKTTTI